MPRYRKNPVSDKDVEDALRVLRADYYSDVLDVARELAKEMKSGDVEEFSDALSQAVDGTQRVIYTYQARIGLLCTGNEDAYVEQVGEVPVQGDTINWEAMMFAAMERDVTERLEASGVDVNDPDSWPDIDLSEFE